MTVLETIGLIILALAFAGGLTFAHGIATALTEEEYLRLSQQNLPSTIHFTKIDRRMSDEQVKRDAQGTQNQHDAHRSPTIDETGSEPTTTHEEQKEAIVDENSKQIGDFSTREV